MVKVAEVRVPPEARLIAERLKRRLDAQLVFLFGSHARGEAGPDSDLDIAVVVANTAQSRYRRSVIARGFVGDIHVSKDVVVLTREEWDAERTVPCSLAHTIDQEGIRLDV